MPASANDIGILTNFLTPRGFEVLDPSSAVGFSLASLYSNSILIAYVQPIGGDARYRDDGVAPTGAVGMLWLEDEIYTYQVSDISAFQIIADTANPATSINVTYYSYVSLAEVAYVVIPVPTYCAIPALVDLNPSAYHTSIINGIEITTTSTGIVDDYGQYADFAQVFVSNADIVHAEFETVNQAITAPANSTTIAQAMILFDVTQGIPIAGLYAVTMDLTQTGDLVDGAGGLGVGTVLSSGNAFGVGYWCAIYADMALGTVSMEDSLGNIFPLTVSGLFNNANQHVWIFAQTAGDILNDELVTNFNTGSQAFVSPINGSVSWCEV